MLTVFLSPSLEQTLIIIHLILNVVCLSGSIYLFFSFIRIKKFRYQCIVKRYPTAQLIFSFSALVLLLDFLIIDIILLTIDIHNRKGNIMLKLCYIVIGIFGLAGLYTLLYRIWLLGFDTRYFDNIANHDWQVILNPSFEKSKETWNKHRQTLGNPKLLANIVIIIVIIFTICLSIEVLFFNTDYMAKIVLNFLYFIGGNIALYIYFTTKWEKKYDTFKIYGEIRLTFIILAISVSIRILSTIFGISVIPSESDFILTSFNSIFASTGFAGGSLFYTLKYMPQDRRNSSLSLFSTSHSEENEVQPKKHSGHVLKNFISTYHGYCVMMKYLSKEYSNEILLFLTEVLQWRQKYRSENVNVEEKLDKFISKMKLPVEVPLSSIVCNDKDTQYESAKQLYYKYIDTNSLYQINIAYEGKLFLAGKFVDEKHHHKQIPKNDDKLLIQIIELNDSGKMSNNSENNNNDNKNNNTPSADNNNSNDANNSNNNIDNATKDFDFTIFDKTIIEMWNLLTNSYYRYSRSTDDL